jgi:hypothetical protein
MARERMAGVFLWTLLLLYVVGICRQLPRVAADYRNRDFGSYYESAQHLLTGRNPYVPEPYWGAPGDTPPWFLLMEPFATLFSRPEAYWVWLAVSLTALGVSLRLLLGAAGVQRCWMVAAIVLMYPPLAFNLWGGMQQVFLLLILVAMLLALRRRHDFLAGLALGTASLLRAYPLGLLGYLVALGRWRAFYWTLVVCGVGAGVTISLLGWPVVLSWMELTGLLHPGAAPMGQPPSVVDFPNNLNVGAFVKWTYSSGDGTPVPVAIAGLGLLIEFALVALVFQRSTCHMSADDEDWRGYGLWIVTVSWISPLSWISYMCCFVPLLIGLAAAWERGEGWASRYALCAMGASYALLVLVPPIGHPLYPLLAHSVRTALSSGPTQALAQTATVKVPSPSAVLSAHHLHWVTCARFVSLTLAWLSAWWFVANGRKEKARARGGEPITLTGLGRVG